MTDQPEISPEIQDLIASRQQRITAVTVDGDLVTITEVLPGELAEDYCPCGLALVLHHAGPCVTTSTED